MKSWVVTVYNPGAWPKREAMYSCTVLANTRAEARLAGIVELRHKAGGRPITVRPLPQS